MSGIAVDWFDALRLGPPLWHPHGIRLENHPMSGVILGLNLAIEAIHLLAKLDANLPDAVALAQRVANLLRHGTPETETAVRTTLAKLTIV